MNFSDNINVATVVATASVILGAAGFVVPKMFNLFRLILKEIYDLKMWQAQYLELMRAQHNQAVPPCVNAKDQSQSPSNTPGATPGPVINRTGNPEETK